MLLVFQFSFGFPLSTQTGSGTVIYGELVVVEDGFFTVQQEGGGATPLQNVLAWWLLVLFVIMLPTCSDAFFSTNNTGFKKRLVQRQEFSRERTLCFSNKTVRIADLDKNKARLLADFSTDSGELIDPYKTLKVSRSATISEIKVSYRTLMKKLHPDKQKFRKVLPGSCNSIEEVEEEFERVKIAYEILSNKKRRLQYDRNTAIADPGAAMARAATDATLSMVGAGLSAGFEGLGMLGIGLAKASGMMQNSGDDNDLP